jgi:hypothetical protein
MNVTPALRHAVLGWAGGAATTLAFGLFLLAAFPGIVRLSPDGSQPGLPLVFGVALLTATPFAAVGGALGGRVAREGGEAEQRWMAVIFGALLSLPAACFNFWAFGGRQF